MKAISYLIIGCILNSLWALLWWTTDIFSVLFHIIGLILLVLGVEIFNTITTKKERKR